MVSELFIGKHLKRHFLGTARTQGPNEAEIQAHTPQKGLLRGATTQALEKTEQLPYVAASNHMSQILTLLPRTGLSPASQGQQ